MTWANFGEEEELMIWRRNEGGIMKEHLMFNFLTWVMVLIIIVHFEIVHCSGHIFLSF